MQFFLIHFEAVEQRLISKLEVNEDILLFLEKRINCERVCSFINLGSTAVTLQNILLFYVHGYQLNSLIFTKIVQHSFLRENSEKLCVSKVSLNFLTWHQ